MRPVIVCFPFSTSMLEKFPTIHNNVVCLLICLLALVACTSNNMDSGKTTPSEHIIMQLSYGTTELQYDELL